MKILNHKYIIAGLALLAVACSDPELPTPVLSTESSNLSASVLFVNASPDASALELYANNIATGANATNYVTVPLTSNSTLSNGNLALRAKAMSGTIGGTLDKSDLIYRATSTGTNNLQASNGGRYTVIATDSLFRPKPIRTLDTARANKPADTTFFNPLSGKFIAVTEKRTLAASQKAKLVPIGTVPLGSTDPGGLRFYIVQDVLATFFDSNVANAGFRLINVAVNTNVYARLKPAAGSPLTLGSNVPYALSFAAFTGTSNPAVPSVGSRLLTTTTFSSLAIATAGVPNTYTLEVSTNTGYTNIVISIPGLTFELGKSYTVVVKGKLKTDNTGLSAEIIKHN
jgi:hypothetical protein